MTTPHEVIDPPLCVGERRVCEESDAHRRMLRQGAVDALAAYVANAVVGAGGVFGARHVWRVTRVPNRASMERSWEAPIGRVP